MKRFEINFKKLGIASAAMLASVALAAGAASAAYVYNGPAVTNPASSAGPGQTLTFTFTPLTPTSPVQANHKPIVFFSYGVPVSGHAPKPKTVKGTNSALPTAFTIKVGGKNVNIHGWTSSFVIPGTAKICNGRVNARYGWTDNNGQVRISMASSTISGATNC